MFSSFAALPKTPTVLVRNTTMNQLKPHYLLMTETGRTDKLGQWRFVLRPVDGSADIVATDVEADVWGERLDLLTVVRALESLDQPSEVTLIGCTRYVEQGIQFGLHEWKVSGWQWEYFGEMTPVRDSDLWQRMDRALQFHRVECGRRRLHAGHPRLQGPHWNHTEEGKNSLNGLTEGSWVKYHACAMVAWCVVHIQMTARLWRRFAGVGLGAGS
jgi:ribonuclease HI